MLDIIYIIIGLVGLFFGGDALVKGAARIAESFGISTLIVGLTIVSLGTSAPELIVNVSAALSGSTELALGNVLGSNVANIALILGLAGVITPIQVHISLIRREIPLAIFLSFALFGMALDGRIVGIDTVLLLIGLVGVNALFIYLARQSDDVVESDAAPSIEAINRPLEFGRLAGGILVLVIAAQLLVTGAVNIATQLGVSELVIGLTLVAFGTSLPELAATVVAALRKETDILVGNIIGSNIYNIVAVLGITSVVRGIPVADEALAVQFPAMLAFTVLMFPFSLNQKFGRWEGFTLLVGYAAFLAITFNG